MPLHMMKAIRFHESGGPEVLRYEDAPTPGLKPGWRAFMRAAQGHIRGKVVLTVR